MARPVQRAPGGSSGFLYGPKVPTWPPPNGPETGRGSLASHGQMPQLRSSRHCSFTRGRRAGRTGSGEGQSLVEFALLFPLFLVLLMGLIEFSLAFNATLGVNQASQNGALLASEAGNMLGADCLILESVERDIQAPADRRSIVEVQVQRTNPSGNAVYARNRYVRAGSTTCTVSDRGAVTVPYTAVETGYPDSQRCNVIAGCPQMVPPHTSVDTIGVQVRYDYAWKTPLGSLMPLIGGTATAGSGYTFQKRNVFRLEPVL